MEVIITSKNIEIVPKAFEGEKSPPTFVFRYPNTKDMLKAIRQAPIYVDEKGNKKQDNEEYGMQFLDDLFIEVKNIAFKNDEGNEKRIEKYSEIFDLTADYRFVSAHLEINVKIGDIIQQIQVQGEKTEKKPKSAGKSGKTKKKR